MHKNRYAGEKKGPIILTNFSDRALRNEDPQKAFDNIANRSGYKDYGDVGSVYDCFYDQSNGWFNPSFDITGPVQLRHTLVCYGRDRDDQIDVRVSEMTVEAYQAVNEKVDFRGYDWDNGGVVNQIVAIYTGYGQATSTRPEAVRPHEFNIEGKNLVLDGVKISTHVCSNKLCGYYAGTGIGRMRNILMSIGITCHEFSHYLGIPNFYDIGKSKNYGTGDWDVTASDSYNGPLGVGWVPPAYTDYEKDFADWLDYTVLEHGPQHVTGMKPLLGGSEAHVTCNPQNHDEYYLLENEGRSKQDSHLSKSDLLVLRVDYGTKLWVYSVVNNIEQKQYNTHQRLTIVSTDVSCGNADHDTYPLGERDSLTANSTPALMLYDTSWDNNCVLHNKMLNIREDANDLINFNYLSNPYFNTARIEPAFNGSVTVTIVSTYNMRGQRMFTAQLDGLPHSLYLLNLSNNTTRKVVVK